MTKLLFLLGTCWGIFNSLQALAGQYKVPGKDLKLLDGFNPISCTRVTECRSLLNAGELKIDQGGPGSTRLIVECEVVSSSEDLCNQLKVDTGLDFEAGFASGSTSVNITSQSGLKSDRVLLLVTAIQDFALESHHNTAFSREALEKFATPAELLAHCGSEIIIGQRRSAEFHLFVSKASDSFGNQSSVGASVAAKIPCLGGMHCSVSTFQSNQGTQTDTNIRVRAFGLGDLSISFPAIEAALADPSKGLEKAKELIEKHFLQCSRENAVPTTFCTEKTECLIERAFGASLSQAFNGPHPRLKEMYYHVQNLAIALEGWHAIIKTENGLSPNLREKKKKRRKYLVDQAQRYGRTLEDLRSIGRQMILDPRTDVSAAISSLDELQENPGRMDWCPYNRTYDLLEETPHLAGRLISDWDAVVREMRLHCVKPVLGFAAMAPTNRKDANADDILYVIFDKNSQFTHTEEHLD
jgi:hypothetical protein